MPLSEDIEVAEELRREISERLNVVETANLVNEFIPFDKGGEVASNRLEDQKMSVHTLYLLPACLACVNTLMLQRVLSEAASMAHMTPGDRGGLTPLVLRHASPHGTFDLDKDARRDLELEHAR